MTYRFSFISALFVVGCSTPGNDTATLFYSGSVFEARDKAAIDAGAFDEDFALYKSLESSARLVLQDWDGALAAVLAAHRLIEGFSGDWSREALAIVGRESAKVFKGEPHERVMNAYYGGLLFAIHGDHENALAGYRNALFRDAPTEGSADFGPALYFLARDAYQKGSVEEGDALLLRARERFPDTTALSSPDLGANVIFMFDLGRGPKKIASGLQGSKIGYRSRSGLSSGVVVSMDNVTLGRSERVEDLFYQASTRGARDFDDVLTGKAIAKEVTEVSGLGLMWAGLNSSSHRDLIGVGGVLFALSSIIQSQVDLRHWGTLPREVQILESTIPPGSHRVAFQVGSRNVFRDIEVPETGEIVVYARPEMEASVLSPRSLERN